MTAQENNLPGPATTHKTGKHNGHDHGMRLKPNLKLPITRCTVCGQAHA